MKFQSYKRPSFYTEQMNARDIRLFDRAFRGDMKLRQWVRDVMVLFCDKIGADNVGQVWQSFTTGKPEALIDALNRKRREHDQIEQWRSFLIPKWHDSLLLSTEEEREQEALRLDPTRRRTEFA